MGQTHEESVKVLLADYGLHEVAIPNSNDGYGWHDGTCTLDSGGHDETI